MEVLMISISKILRKVPDYKSGIESYILLRRSIGILGALLPFICMFGAIIFAGEKVQDSISQYYHTNMRDFFVGIMICVSVFLITYRGHNILDTIVTVILGIAGLSLTTFPCRGDKDFIGLLNINSDTSNLIHLISAVSFFSIFALMSIFIFTLTDKNKIEKNKKIRNIIYIICGIIIIVILLTLLFLNIFLQKEVISKYNLIFIFETVMLVIFSISWLIKGKTLFVDHDNGKLQKQ
jgi:hypothetical protein